MRLGAIHWSGLRILALLVAALGAYGVLSSIREIVQATPPTMRLIANPVFGNPQRLDPPQAVEILTRDYPGNFRAAFAFALFSLILGVHFFALLRNLYPRAPLASLVAGLLLGGSVFCGLILGLTVLKVDEFALQAAVASAEEQSWLRGGINFLRQIHVIFASGWFLCIGLAWVFVGWAVLRGGFGLWLFGTVQLVAGVAVLSSVMARAWLPTYGAQAPALAVFMSGEALQNTGLVWGLLASGIVGWVLANKTTTTAETSKSLSVPK